MAARGTTRALSDRHEEFLAKLIDGRRTPGSGNGFANQADVRGDHRRQHYAFALDGKATEAKSITVKLSDWEKIVEQSHDEIPGLALRFYHDGSLRRSTDLIVIDAGTFADLLIDSRAAYNPEIPDDE
jgi:hypothetical protein